MLVKKLISSVLTFKRFQEMLCKRQMDVQQDKARSIKPDMHLPQIQF